MASSDLSSVRVPAISPQVESIPSGSYTDFRFSRQTSIPYQASFSDGYNSEEYIDIYFPREPEISHNDNLMENRQGLQAQSVSTKDTEDNVRAAGLKLLRNEFKDKGFLRISDESLRVEVEDFYTSLALGIDSLKGLANSFFLLPDFMQQSIILLQTLDTDVRTLLEKFSDLRLPSSEDFCHALLEYTRMSGKLVEVCNALKFSTALLNEYQSSQAAAAVEAVEVLVALRKSAPRAIHISKAEEARKCIDSARAKRIQMQVEVQALVQSRNYGSFSFLVPSLINIMNPPQSGFEKWSGLWGVLFAMKTASFYICQLLLAGLAHAGEGPAIILASTNMASFNSGWATSLVGLHIQVRKQFNTMKDTGRGSCNFMSRDNDLLEFMLQDTKGHLQSLLDQGKFLNIGVYLGSWQADRKKLVHNVPRLRQHLLDVRYRLSALMESIESLASSMRENINDGRRHLDQVGDQT